MPVSSSSDEADRCAYPLLRDHPTACRPGALDVKLLNVCVAYQPGRMADQKERYPRAAKAISGRYAWCTSFDRRISPRAGMPKGSSRESRPTTRTGRAPQGLEEHRHGAPQTLGDYVRIDDPSSSPSSTTSVARASGLMHREPRECWLPLDPFLRALRLLQHASRMAHARQARHSLLRIPHRRGGPGLERNPKVRFIGAQPGQPRARPVRGRAELDRYANLMVDTGARMINLMRAERSDARRFPHPLLPTG